MGVCFCLAFPFIFCCHGCISGALQEQKRTEKLNRMNQIFFGGRPVLSTTEQHGLLINTDYISVANSFNTVSLAYVDDNVLVNPLMGHMEYRTAQASAIPIAVGVPDAHNTASFRSMTVTIPQGASPGTVLTVSTPDSIIVNVSFVFILIFTIKLSEVS